MKKIFNIAVIILFGLSLIACDKKDIYKVGASPVPHSEILRYVQPILKEQGYEFEIVEFTDYVLPNQALDSEELIANFFQHIPYLENQIDEYSYDFTNIGGVHVEPIGLYSKKYTSLDTLGNDIEIIISNSPSDRPRLLSVLDENGIITLNSDVSNQLIISSTLNELDDLFTSNYNVTFTEVDAALLYTNYINQEGDVVLINGNYALDNGLNPLQDALCLEGAASLYTNILVAKTENIDDPFVQALINALQSEEVSNWIKEQYEGSVVPVN